MATPTTQAGPFAHRDGQLRACNSDPFARVDDRPVASDAMAPYQSLTTSERESERNRLERGSHPLDEVLAPEPVHRPTDFLPGVDDEGLRVPVDHIADTVIDLQFASTPKEGKRATAYESCSGNHPTPSASTGELRCPRAEI